MNVEKYNVNFKKKYGQNFLKDINIVDKILKTSDIDNNSLVIEVGPGGAIMTTKMANLAKNVVAYEIDKELEEELSKRTKDYNNIEIIYKDFLTCDLAKDISKYKFEKLLFISNVPYYITTPIINKILETNLYFDNITMMVQKELGERLSSSPGSKDYGAITVLLNYYYDIKKQFEVSRKCFIPEPNVDSMIISFKEKKDKLYLKDINFFKKIVKDSFQFKRKNLRNNLFNYDLEIVSEVLKKYNYDLTVRSEKLELEIFVDLANSLYK